MTRPLSPSLGTRIFLVNAALLLLAVGSSVAITWTLGTRIATKAARDRILATNSVQSAFQQQRYELLLGPVRLLAQLPTFKAYIVEAIDTDNPAAVFDQLTERQRDLGYDLALLLDAGGVLFARTDDPEARGSDFSRNPFVAQARKGTASGVWQEGERLYYAVAEPLTLAEDPAPLLFGYLVAGFALDDRLALDVQRITGSEVAYLSGGAGGPAVVATTLEPALEEKLLAALRLKGDLLGRVIQRGDAVDQIELEVDGRNWIALLTPLRDAAGSPVGASVALASLDRELATYRRIQGLLLGVGALALLAGVALSYALSRRALAPVRRLAAATEAARQGSYDLRLEAGGSREVAQLARSFNDLLADLRERRDMQDYVMELSRSLPEATRRPAPAAPEARPRALLAVELRRYARPRGVLEPVETLERMGRDLRRVASAVGARGGRIEAAVGHRVLAAFDGEGHARRALQAAAEILGVLSSRDLELGQAEPPVIAVAAGDALSGAVTYADEPERALLGPPVQQIEVLLREASPGDLVLSAAVHAELAAAFAESGIELAAQRSLLSTQPVFILSSELAARVAGGAPGGTQATVALPGSPGAAPAVAPGGRATLADIAPGSLLGGRFEILSVLGAGGMGVVFKARDRELDDLVALKMLKREVAGDRDLLDRLKSELKLARKITHPNVLRTFDFGELDGVPFISMEYVRGVTLRYLLEASGRPPFSAALHVGKQLCNGLSAAHALAILHRDIKPENMIIDQGGNAKLMDFGLARPVQQMAGGGITQAGFLVGTPHYLAPEQIQGREPSFATDLYAVGVVLYELFTGTLPFGGGSPMDVLLKHLSDAPAPPRERWPEIPERLERLLLRCLEKEPEKRFARVGELQRELDQLST